MSGSISPIRGGRRYPLYGEAFDRLAIFGVEDQMAIPRVKGDLDLVSCPGAAEPVKVTTQGHRSELFSGGTSSVSMMVNCMIPSGPNRVGQEANATTHSSLSGVASPAA